MSSTCSAAAAWLRPTPRARALRPGASRATSQAARLCQNGRRKCGRLALHPRTDRPARCGDRQGALLGTGLQREIRRFGRRCRENPRQGRPRRRARRKGRHHRHGHGGLRGRPCGYFGCQSPVPRVRGNPHERDARLPHRDLDERETRPAGQRGRHLHGHHPRDQTRSTGRGFVRRPQRRPTG